MLGPTGFGDREADFLEEAGTAAVARAAGKHVLCGGVLVTIIVLFVQYCDSGVLLLLGILH